MAWAQTFFGDLAGVWEIEEIRIFVWVVIIGAILYFLLIHLRTIIKFLSGKRKHDFYTPKEDTESHGLLSPNSTEHKDRNFEVYSEHVMWSEKPILIFKIRQILMERSLYGVAILALIILILWKLFW